MENEILTKLKQKMEIKTISCEQREQKNEPKLKFKMDRKRRTKGKNRVYKILYIERGSVKIPIERVNQMTNR